MTRFLKRLALALVLLLLIAALAAAWFVGSRQPKRDGTLELGGLQAPVSVRYDERGVPHIRAENEDDLYRALGYVQAQDRLFQMEMVRRLARGELAEILGPKLVEIDRFFRVLGIRAHADAYVARMDRQSPTWRALDAYLDGINRFQATRPLPLEFAVLGIHPRPFTANDVMSVAGYLAYTFAATLRTEPPLTFIRDRLGPDYLRAFDLDWYPQGVLGDAAPKASASLAHGDWEGLARFGSVSLAAAEQLHLPLFEGSNAWAIAGSRTASGKAILAGDPHIAFSVPAVWYEAHLSMPGFELYGYHQALNPMALLGHNQRFGWSLTMFENDDMDLVVERPNPQNPNQVWFQGRWVDMQAREETIAVKGAEPVKLTLHRSPHGPIINDALGEVAGKAPVALWWTFLETENPILDAFHALNRADTLDKARHASSMIHAPGLNVVWANAGGDIGWWAAAALPRRPPGVNPVFMLDGATGEADKAGYYPFSVNPREENPARGYIVSANHQPAPASGVPVPGYYCLPDRVRSLDRHLADPARKWDMAGTRALQLETRTDYGPRVLAPLLPVLREVVDDPAEKALLDQLATWNGDFVLDAVAPTLFSQMSYELARGAMADELGEAQFKTLLKSRALDFALPRLAADAASPWWDDKATAAVETRKDTLKAVWRATVGHLQATLGKDPAGWTWGKAHTLTHVHPLGRQAPLDKVFNVGPFGVPGGRETPNNLSGPIGPAPWAVTMGPSTRRAIDFAHPGAASGGNPVGQSGVLFDAHYADQAASHARGEAQAQHLDEADVAAHTRSTLTLVPR